MGADPDHDADDGNRGPQAEHRAPVEQPAEAELSRFRAAPGAASRHARLALARRLVVLIFFVLAFGHRFLGFVVVVGGRNAIFGREPQVGERCRKPE